MGRRSCEAPLQDTLEPTHRATGDNLVVLSKSLECLDDLGARFVARPIALVNDPFVQRSSKRLRPSAFSNDTLLLSTQRIRMIADARAEHGPIAATITLSI
jgi:hypothetical protein